MHICTGHSSLNLLHCKINRGVYTRAMVTYLEQLDALCALGGLDLAAVCNAEGVAATTLWRWRNRKAHCREATALALFERIGMMASPAPVE